MDNSRPVLAVVCLALLSACSPPETVEIAGRARYEKQLISTEGRGGTELRPIVGCDVELFNVTSGRVLARSVTADDGSFGFEAAQNEQGGLAIRVFARATGPRLNIEVVGADAKGQAWSSQTAGAPWEIVVKDRYAAGAYNVVAMARLAAASLQGVTSDKAPKLLVRWAEELTPACGSCFYEEEFRLDLTGLAGDEDAHDDFVLLHELGHYIEAAFGEYSNPGGLHNLQLVAPTLAWSEGFASWFAAALKGEAQYYDVQPTRVYTLDMESPPDFIFGTEDGTAQARLSEALVYAVLWDLIDAPSTDDDGGSQDIKTVLSTALGLLDVRDVGANGTDLLDFANDWSCERDAAHLRAALDLVAFPSLPTAICD